MENQKAFSTRTGDEEQDCLYNHAMARAATGLKTGFHYHLACYLTANLLMLLVSLDLTPKIPLMRYLAMGWGMGIIIHGLAALVLSVAAGPKRV